MSAFLLQFTAGSGLAQSLTGKRLKDSDIIDLVGLPPLPLPDSAATLRPGRRKDLTRQTLPPADETATGSVPSAADERTAGTGPRERTVVPAPPPESMPRGAGKRPPVRVILPAPQPAMRGEDRSDAGSGLVPAIRDTGTRIASRDLLDGLQASLLAPELPAGTGPIRLEVVAPLPPVRPRAADRLAPLYNDSVTPLAAEAPPSARAVDVAALGSVTRFMLPPPITTGTTVLPQASPPVSEPLTTGSIDTSERSAAPAAAAPPPPAPPIGVATPADAPPALREALPAPVALPAPPVPPAKPATAPALRITAPAPTPAPAVRTADARAPGTPEEPVFYERRAPRLSDDSDSLQPRRKLSSEWELPRAARRGRPALNQTSAAAAPSLPSTRVAYVVRNQNLDQLVREIGQLAGVRVVPGPGVRGAVRERRLDGPFESVLDNLTREFGLFWFADGGTVYVDPQDEQKTKFFKVRGSSPDQIERALEAAGLSRHRDRVQPVGGDGLVRASGPDTFLRTVEAALTGVASADQGAVQLIKFGQRAP